MDHSARFALPFLAPGQLQKELFHNEALQTVDMLLCPLVDGAPSNSPPNNPVLGSCYLVGSSPSGVWTGQGGTLACFTSGGWRFAAPTEGMAAADRACGQWWNRRSGNWELGIIRGQEVRVDDITVLRGRQPPIENASGGTVIDSECRATVDQILAAMRTHGLIG